MIMTEKIKALELENVKLNDKLQFYESKYEVIEVKLKSLEDKLSDVEQVICTDSDEDASADDTDVEPLEGNDDLYDELKNLIANSQKKREVWEKSHSLEDDGPS